MGNLSEKIETLYERTDLGIAGMFTFFLVFCYIFYLLIIKNKTNEDDHLKYFFHGGIYERTHCFTGRRIWS